MNRACHRSFPSSFRVPSDSFRVYLSCVSAALRSQLQYRASALMLTFSNLVGNAAEFFAIWALFDRFRAIKGWTLPEVALLYGMAHMAFALSEIIGRGFDMFAPMVQRGDFDRVLLRPRGSAFLVACSAFDIKHMGRFLQGLVVLLWGMSALHIPWTSPHALFVLVAVGSGCCFFVGLFVLQAVMAFWTIESLEIVNTVTYGGVETAQYPLSVYHPWFRRFFIYVVPLACVNYFPGLAVLGRSDPLGFPIWVSWFAPALGVFFLAISLQIWKIGVRHYRSTGS
jgi:ABC-2 type transport system permease protein